MSDASMPQDVPPPMQGGGGKIEFAPEAAISFGWAVLKKDPVVALVLLLAAVVSNALPSIGNGIDMSAQLESGSIRQTGGSTLYWILFAVNLPISSWIACGTWRYVLKVARGQPAEVGEIFSGGPVLPMLVATLLFTVGMLVGLVLFIVPGIIFTLGCWFFAPLIVDTNCGAVDSLKASWDLTKGHKVQLFVLWLFMIGLMIAGILACCVGVFVALPIAQLAMAYAYLTVTGQGVVRPA